MKLERLHPPGLRPGILLGVLCALTCSASAETVALMIVDQDDVPIAGSALRVDGTTIYANGSEVVLAPGTHQVELLPGLGGSPQAFVLYRTEMFTILPGQTQQTFEWITASLTVDVEDQNGQSLLGSMVNVVGVNFATTPFQVVLPVSDPGLYPGLHGPSSENEGKGYDVTVAPGMNGQTNNNYLYRREGYANGSVVEVHAGQTELVFEWITTAVTVDVEDQFGQPLPGSMVNVVGVTFAATPYTITVPITDAGVYPSLGGPGSENEGKGYDVTVAPGMNGQTNNNYLYRREGYANGSVVEVHSGQGELVFEWTTTALTVDVHDQHGQSIPGGQVQILHAAYQPTPYSLVLPISDAGAYPSLGGPDSENEALGYDVDVVPGLGGQAHNKFLYRREGYAGGPLVEVHAGQQYLSFEWIQLECSAQVVDAFGEPVPGSELVLPSPFGAFVTGQTLTLPITENALYPTVAGAYGNGYPIGVRPGDVWPVSSTFEFEALASGGFTPASFVIAGRSYSLACQVNQPPQASAGDNLAILSWQQAATTLLGVASDSDGDTLTYLWREGTSPLFGPALVGGGGEAPLALADVAPFTVGTHILTLEVSDGALTATSSMQLDVGNSPPEVSCAGGGTYQLGLDAVLLGAVVADFDGDTLLWEWASGATVLASGLQATTSGGGPVSLPTTSLATGVGTGLLGLGAHTLSLRCDDGVSPPAECTLLVQVVDTQAPTLAPMSSTLVLWPPDHRMVDVTILANAHDGSGAPVVLTAAVTSSEDPLKDGSGQTIPDFTEPVIDQASGTVTLQLRAERSGRGPGRTYTITVTATDLAGNQSSASVVVVAPHDKRRS